MKGYWNSPIVRRLPSKKGLTGFFCLLLGVGVIWWLLVPKEPSYQGKTLTEWQDEMVDAFPVGSMRGHQETINEIRQKFEPPFKAMGKNVIPFLLRQIQAKDSDFERWVRARCEDRGWPVPLYHDQWIDRRRAEKTFAVLRQEAYPAVPELLRLAREERELRPLVFYTLTGMEVTSEEFLRMLVESARSFSDVERGSATHCLYEFCSNAKDAMPVYEKIIAEDRANGRDTRPLEKMLEIITKKP